MNNVQETTTPTDTPACSCGCRDSAHSAMGHAPHDSVWCGDDKHQCDIDLQRQPPTAIAEAIEQGDLP